MKGILLSVCTAALLVPAASGVANARSMQADAGQLSDERPYTGQYYEADACLRRSDHYGSITNSGCGGATWHIPLVVDSAGYKTVTINGHMSIYMGQIGSCRVVSWNQDVTYYWATNWTDWPIPDTGSLTFTGVGPIPPWVPSGGFMYIDCTLNQGGDTIQSVNWNP